MTSSPDPGRSLAAHVQRLTEMMQAMDAEHKAYEEWLLRVDADLNTRIAATENELAAIRADTDQRIEAIRADTDQRIETIRAESADQRRAHQAWVQTVEAQIASHRETMSGLLDGLVQAQADISRLDAAS